MTSNPDRADLAAEIIAPWIEKEWGLPEDNAESAADALAAAGVLAPDFAGSISENEAGKFFISKSTNIGAENSARINNPEYWGNEGPVISVNSGFVNPTEARELAAAILAAADHAEKAAAHVDETLGDTDD